MQSPQQLKNKLAKQWQSADHREKRLLGDFQWPLMLNINLPKAAEVNQNTPSILIHIKQWRAESTGQVEWRSVNYKGISESVELPVKWHLTSPSEWIQATTDQQTIREFKQLSKIISQVDSLFHRLLVRQKSLWCINSEVMIQCCFLANQLMPGMAQGKPLRALTFSNYFQVDSNLENQSQIHTHIDSKFIEKNRLILIKLLNLRFNDQLKNMSLEKFLNAAENKEHWLLVVSLNKSSLPFQQVRLRSSELAHINLPVNRLIIVENEQCLYQLPELDDCIAILGAGLNLSWLNNPYFDSKKIAYWGDIDSWGFKMLSIARKAQPKIRSLLMNEFIFEKYQNMAVIEPQSTEIDGVDYLNQIELACVNFLKRDQKTAKLNQQSVNRLEQEFIAKEDVVNSVGDWLLIN